MVVSKQSNITVRLKLSLSAQYANAEPVKIEANAKGEGFWASGFPPHFQFMICHFFDRTFDYNKGRILHGNCLFMNDLTLTLHPIAVIHTPYKEKFSVPRQPDLVQDGIGIVELLPPYNSPEAVRGLEQFSHLWLIFQFDKVPHGKWQSTVRPPRLGGNQRVGVFASPRYASP